MKAVLLLLASLAGLRAAQTATVKFIPLCSTITRGDSTSVNIAGTNFTELPSGFLDGGGVNLTFNSSVVQVSSVSIAPFWDPAFSVPGWSIDNLQGTVAPINFGTAGQGASGSFDIATLVFQVVGLGNCSLALTENPDNPFGSGGTRVGVVFQPGAIVGVVPSTPTRISYAVGDSTITISWPIDYQGWSLQVQTNPVSRGISTNWVTVPNSALTNSMTFPLPRTSLAVFYRLFYQFPTPTL